MGLDSFTSNSDTNDEQKADESEHSTPDNVTETQQESTKEYIAENIRIRVYDGNFDASVSDGRIEADLNDLAMLFALMTMDISDSDFDSLVNDRE